VVHVWLSMYLYDATRERILFAERVAECRHPAPNAQASCKGLETFASVEELDFYDACVKRAIRVRGFIATFSQHVRVELGKCQHCSKIM
jgi:hypothetical protein